MLGTRASILHETVEQTQTLETQSQRKLFYLTNYSIYKKFNFWLKASITVTKNNSLSFFIVFILDDLWIGLGCLLLWSFLHAHTERKIIFHEKDIFHDSLTSGQCAGEDLKWCQSFLWKWYFRAELSARADKDLGIVSFPLSSCFCEVLTATGWIFSSTQWIFESGQCTIKQTLTDWTCAVELLSPPSGSGSN